MWLFHFTKPCLLNNAWKFIYAICTLPYWFFIKIAKAEATGIYSQSIYKKLGFETLGRFDYEDYPGKDEEGNPVFQNMGKHKSIDFVVKTIS